MHTRSEPAQLLEVNLSVLDSLVLDYLAHEELIEDVSGAVEGLLQRRAAATAAYQQLQQGHLASVLAIVEQFCPAVLHDQRLAFKLKRQQFIELLRQGSAAGDAAALACARDELAPLALDAYPEAYLDFKKALLLLLHVQSGGSSSGSSQQQRQELSLQARQELAEVLHHTMLQQLGCTAPTLSLLVTYLLLLWDQHTGLGAGSSSRAGRGTAAAVQQLLAASGAELVPGLLLEGRDAAPLPPDVSGQGHPERDVQALMAAVGITRQVAVDGLKAAGGDAALALGRQLQRLRLNKPQLDALLWEYACDRGLVEPTESPAAAAAAALAAAALLADSSAPAAAAAMDIDTDHTSAAAAAAAAPVTAAVAGSGSGSSSCGSKPLVTSAKRSSPAASEGGAGAAAAAGGRGGSSAAAQAADASAAAAVTPGEAVAAALGSPSAAGVAGGVGAAGEPAWPAAMLRSESQSPPYKVPRWRSKQTPSRFCGLAPAPAQQQQQQPKPAAAAADAPQQQQQQDQQQQALAQQLVHWARQEQQQRRWQQLQHALKSRAAAAGGAGSSSGGSSGSSGGGSSRAVRAAEVSAGLQQLGRLVKGGEFAGVEVCLEELAPGLLGELPSVKFDVKRCQFMQLVERGQPSEALLLARSQLTPLADQHPELLPTLKASMALLLPAPLRAQPAAAAYGAPGGSGSAAPSSSSSSSSASSSAELGSALLAQLLPLLQERLGVEPSPLVTLLRLLLTSHRGWFRVQRCQDPFASALWIDRLLLVQPAGAGLTALPGAGGAAGLAPKAAAAGGAGQQTFADAAAANEDELMLEEDDLGDGELDESAVLQVMEVLELPRATALELLADHGGDAQAAIMSVLSA